MGNENELKEYCCEMEDIKVKDEPIEYDVNIDDKKIISDTVESGNVKLEFDDKKHIQNHEALDAEDCIVSCKVEVEESCVCANDVNQNYNTKHDALLVTENIEGITANGDILYNCPRCTYTSNSRRNYREHVQRHDGIKKFACTICQGRFHEKGTLQRHILTHGGQKPFKCSLCDYGAIRKECIDIHMRDKHTGTGEKRYKCPKCEYKTNYKCNWKQHEIVHEDTRLYECEICNKQFKSAGSLKSHGFVHDEETRYQCAHCDFKTKTKRGLSRHLYNKHLGLKNKHPGLKRKKYECSKCTYKTIYSSTLKRHSRKHLNNVEKKYKCQRCPHQSNRKYDLRRHNKLHDNPNS